MHLLRFHEQLRDKFQRARGPRQVHGCKTCKVHPQRHLRSPFSAQPQAESSRRIQFLEGGFLLTATDISAKPTFACFATGEHQSAVHDIYPRAGSQSSSQARDPASVFTWLAEQTPFFRLCLIKSTLAYKEGKYCEYDEIEMLQMIGPSAAVFSPPFPAKSKLP